MSEGLHILRLISTKGGCLLSELAVELNVPVSSVTGWVQMLCSIGYLKQDGRVESGCECTGSCSACVCCHCSHSEKKDDSVRIEVTERGLAAIRRVCG